MATNYILKLLPFFLICSFFSFSQQEPTSTLFWNNYLHTNPAMTGAVYKHQAHVSWKDYRAKKALYEGMSYPQTIFANYAAKIDTINSGIGVSYRFDSQSAQQMQTALLSYAYHIPIKSMFLSIGASAGIKSLSYTFPDSSGTKIIKQNFSPAFTTDFGIALRHEKWNVGLSMTQWNGPAIHQKDSGYYFNLNAHFWFFGDYRFTSGENWSLTPRIQLAYDRFDLFTNVQLIAAWKQNLWFGLGIQGLFRYGFNFYAVSPMIGYDIKGRFRIGYTALIHGQGSNYFNLFKPVTQEVVLGFMLK
jgi:type IX secretion system PorP/SprF family membrane protein